MDPPVIVLAAAKVPASARQHRHVGGSGNLEGHFKATPTLAPALESSAMASGSTTVLPCVKACDYSDMSDPAACCGELQRGSRHTYLDACLGEQGNGLGHTVLQPVLHSCGPKQLKVTLNLLCHLGNLLIPALQADTRLMEALVPLLQSSYSCEKVWRLCGLVRRFWLAAGASFRQADTGSVEALAPLLITAVTHRRCCLAASATTYTPRYRGDCLTCERSA